MLSNGYALFLLSLLTACITACGSTTQIASQPYLAQLQAMQQPQQVVKGHLIVIGGGERPAAIVRKIIELSGGNQGKILIVPHASSIPEEVAQSAREQFQAYGARNVHIFQCSPKAVDTPACLQQFEGVNGIYFTGGDQNVLSHVFQNTRAFQTIVTLFKRGGLIAGTSAGAAIMSQVMLTGTENKDSQDSSEPFTSIKKNRVNTTPGFGFINRYIIDQHFIKRKRQDRLLSVVLDHPNLIGVGIDESTAILVNPDQSFEVLGENSVLIYDARQAADISSDRNQNYSARNIKIHLLTAGQTFN